VELAQAGIAFGLESGRHGIACFELHPHQAVGFDHAMAQGAVRGGRRELRQRRHVHASPAGLELPAMVGALDATAMHPAQGQARSPVRTPVR